MISALLDLWRGCLFLVPTKPDQAGGKFFMMKRCDFVAMLAIALLPRRPFCSRPVAQLRDRDISSISTGWRRLLEGQNVAIEYAGPKVARALPRH